MAPVPPSAVGLGGMNTVLTRLREAAYASPSAISSTIILWTRNTRDKRSEPTCSYEEQNSVPIEVVEETEQVESEFIEALFLMPW